MSKVISNGYRFVLFIFIVATMTACYQKPEYEDIGREGEMARTRIERYYSLLNKAQERQESPFELNGTFDSLLQKDNQIPSLYAMTYYLYTKGYGVRALGEPRFISYQKPYAIYAIDVEVKYPDDIGWKEKRISTTETIWMDASDGNYFIAKIKSQDLFISARVCNFEYDSKTN